MEVLGQTPVQTVLFFILYGISGVMPLMAALYLLLRRANAFAPGVTPPMQLRRWTAAFFAVSTLAHVWWLLLYIYSWDLNSLGYLVLVMVDCVLFFVTFAGMLLAMLQDRRRSVWPTLIAMIPFVGLAGAHMVFPSSLLEQLAAGYLLLLGLLFTAYMVFAIRRYDRWLNDNYADLENKKVWLCQAVALVCMLLFMLYVLATDIVLIWLIHIIDIVLIGLLLWRVETLPDLETHPQPLPEMEGSEGSQGCNSTDEQTTPLTYKERLQVDEPCSGIGQGGGSALSIDLDKIEQLLKEHCVTPQLYLQHDLTLQQLALSIGTNRYYLSQYFSRQGITYNIYINSQRVNHFIRRYQEHVKAGESVSAQQLAHESGFSSYRTFSRAFTQRMGQSVTAWMNHSTE